MEQKRIERTDNGWQNYRPLNGLIRALKEVEGTDDKIRFEVLYGTKIYTWRLTQDEVKQFIWQTQQQKP